MNPFDKAADAVRTQVVALLPAVRTLLIDANEAVVAKPQGGMTADEAQAEVLAQATLALRALEDAAMRLNCSKHVFLGDSTLFPDAAAKTDETDDESDDDSDSSDEAASGGGAAADSSSDGSGDGGGD